MHQLCDASTDFCGTFTDVSQAGVNIRERILGVFFVLDRNQVLVLESLECLEQFGHFQISFTGDLELLLATGE
jgi:hypothetical protein